MPLKVTDTTDGSPIFITGGEIEAVDAQTVRIVLWTDLPATGSVASSRGSRPPLPSPFI